MIAIKRTDEFAAWFDAIKDRVVKQRLSARLRKASLGNFGDVGPVGEGISEFREHFGAGWRMYFVQRGQMLIVLLGGGTKATQTADIRRAKAVAMTLEEEEKRP
ncbi:MAG: type II toxin-antitoxin system RelE/ParE family toxin [Candidatus Accumulibacter sp.]|jgi:putative addiction module killer protein|nr:type II toxin-antitoxin system RelE/ParE family toxin [Accumulibacter sp.]